MSQRGDRRIRRELGRLKRTEQEVSDKLVRELLAAPFKIRLHFALALLFRRRK